MNYIYIIQFDLNKETLVKQTLKSTKNLYSVREMEILQQLDRQLFLECNWSYTSSDDQEKRNYSIMNSLKACANIMKSSGKINCSDVLEFLASVASMRLVPANSNDLFEPMLRICENGVERQTLIPEDITEEQLSFFEEILGDVDESYLKARLADLIWILKKPKNVSHARIAIDSYMALANYIDDEMWFKEGSVFLERATQLCMQIKDNVKLAEIKGKLFSAFLLDYPNSKFMNLSIAELMNKLKIDKDYKKNIALFLYNKAEAFINNGDIFAARTYFEFVTQKYKQVLNEDQYINSLIRIAETFENEAGAINSNIVANECYANSLEAYRRVPVKKRKAYGVDAKISLIKQKIKTSGQNAIGEMFMYETKETDISRLIQSSINKVRGKETLKEALTCFIKLSSGANYQELVGNAKEILDKSFFSSLFGISKMSGDGRVTARIPAMNRSAGEDDDLNREVLNNKIHEHFSIQIQLIVQSRIFPALRQIRMEHRFDKESMVSICSQAKIVPKGRENLLGYALWLGMEGEFGAAIHLLCPQVEHIIRTELKRVGAHTTTISSDQIETENGLSTLMELPEAEQIFGKSLAFEIRSIFTESLGANLRNEVAHGLLDDKSSSSVYTVYAWWMILRLVMLSTIDKDIKRD